MKKMNCIGRTVCAVICAVFTLALVGCGNDGHKIDELQSKIDELQTQVEELQSYFYPDGHIYEKDEPAMIFSNGMPLLKVTFVGYKQTVEGTRLNFLIENVTSSYFYLSDILAFCGATNESVSSTYSCNGKLAPKETINYDIGIGTTYDFVYCGFPSAHHSYGTNFYNSNTGVIPAAIFRVH